MARLRWLVVAVLFAVTLGCQPTSEPAAETPAPAPAPAKEEAAAPVMETVKAKVGVGKKGRSLDNEKGVGGMIVEPARQLFAFKEKAVFDIQIPQAMQLFKATEGRAPNSHEEFMTKIVKANNIQLPELPEGQQYMYDPEAEQLMVKRPQ